MKYVISSAIVGLLVAIVSFLLIAPVEKQVESFLAYFAVGYISTAIGYIVTHTHDR